MCSSGPCERRFNLRQEERFNKGARAIIHSNCLLPVLSDGGLKFLVTSFECFGVCRFTAAAIAVHPARKISSAETVVRLRRQMRMTRSRVGTHMIEHLADGLADHMQFAAYTLALSNIVLDLLDQIDR